MFSHIQDHKLIWQYILQFLSQEIQLWEWI